MKGNPDGYADIDRWEDISKHIFGCTGESEDERGVGKPKLSFSMVDLGITVWYGQSDFD